MTADADSASIVRRLFVANSLGLVILLIGWCVAFAAGWEATWDGFMGSSYDQGRHNMLLLLFWVAALATPVAAVTAAALLKRRLVPEWASRKAWVSSLIVVIGGVVVLAVSIAVCFSFFRQPILLELYQLRWLLSLTLPLAAQLAFASFAARQEIRRITPLT